MVRFFPQDLKEMAYEYNDIFWLVKIETTCTDACVFKYGENPFSSKI